MRKFNERTKNEVKDLVAEIEKQTTGEVVPVLLTHSDLYPAAHFRWALLLSFIIPIIMYFAPLPIHDPIWFLAGQGCGAIFGIILGFNARAKRFMLTRGEIKEEVHQRALQAYFEHGVHTTKNRDGVMIFISMLEQRAEILADIGIAAKVSNDQWNDILKKTLLEIKKGDLNTALMGTIRQTGELLTQHFPRSGQENSDQRPSELDDGLRTE